ncbi:MAG: 6-phosphogluconolactonase [Syntrophorhabdales bacterium]
MAHDVVRRPYGRPPVLVLETREEMWTFMVGRFREKSERAIRERGRFSAGLSGGKTPEDLYLEMGRVGQDTEWGNIHIFLVDERFVPLGDDRSNYGMIKRTLLDKVPIPAANVHSIETEESDLRTSALNYEADLQRFFGTGPATIPAFDMILLGMGQDGHTASLFPGLSDLRVEKRLVREVEATLGTAARVTLTLPVINHGRTVFFLVTGKAKAGIVRRVVEERDPDLPASLVAPLEGELFFVCDGEAASMLDKSTGRAKTAHSRG